MKRNSNVFRSLLMTCLLLLGVAVEARTISGVVTDQTGETVISASVIVKGTSIGTVTDFDGNYTLDVPDDATVLVFSYIGLETQEVQITGNVINVVLKENSEVLEEVVVTGYGTTKKRDLVTSVASVSSDQLKDIPVTSAAEALQGKLSGVQVTTSEGSPDADVKIRVRGGTSLTQSSEPLYIVDGFPVSSISDIAPGDIASMDVLKDAAATAIYGAQGANGVIIITTKDTKADGDKMVIHADYSGYMGWRTLANKYKMMNNEDYLRMQYEYMYMSERNAPSDSKIKDFYDRYRTYDPSQGRYLRTQPIAGRDVQYYNYDPATQTSPAADALPDLINFWNQKGSVDWQNEIFGGNHLNSNHNFSISGGIKAANFNFSYNRVDDKSIMYGSDYNRNNLSLKTKFQPIKGLTIAATARFTNTNVLGAGTNGAEDAGSKGESRLRNAVSFLPMYGAVVKLASSDDEGAVDENSWNLYNPFDAIDDSYKKKVDNKLTLNGYIQYKFLKHFTLKAEIGYENRTVKQDRYYGPTTSYARTGPGRSQTTSHTNDYLGHTIATDAFSTRLKQTNTFEYAQKFDGNAHDFSLLIGEEQTINKGETRYTYGFGFDPKMGGPKAFNLQGLAMESAIKNYVLPNDNMLSFFARANYNYMGRYYITATFRADASTKFAKGHQWGFFPSVAVAWRIIDEPWMEPAQDVMSNFKFRLSYGTVGNNNVELGYLRADYTADNTNNYMQGMNNILIDGKTGTDTKLIAANENLKWETTITRDFGIDYGFFNERLSGALDLYWNTTKDLILRYRLAGGGYDYQYRNIGSTDNKGVEFSIKGVILDHRSKALSYGLTLDANVSYNFNKVVDLGGMDSYSVMSECFSLYYKTQAEFVLTPGSAIGDVYGYKTNGIYTTADFTRYNKRTGTWQNDNGDIETPLGPAYPGMTKLVQDEYIDEKGNKQFKTSKIGNTMPIVTGGFNLGCYVGGDAWGKVDLSANFTYSIGNDVVNLTALDYSTVCSQTKNRNLLVDYSYDKRYSLFTPEGQLIGSQFMKGQITSGDDFAKLAAAVEEANAGKTVANPYVGSTALTDKYIEDGSYLRLSSLNFGYSLPNKWIEKAHITNARIFFSASNLFVVSKYSGADPEVDTRSKVNPLAVGVDFSAFPKSRGFNFGINLSF